MSAKKKATVTVKENDAVEQTHQLMADGNLDKIRDILFGAQRREADRRFERLEEHVRAEVSELREEMKGALSRIEQFIKGEADSLSGRIKKEQGERNTEVDRINQVMDEQRRRLDGKHSDLEERFDREMREMRQQVLDQGQELSENVRKSKTETDTKLEWGVRELREAKIDKSELASFFTELGLRINRQPEDENE